MMIAINYKHRYHLFFVKKSHDLFSFACPKTPKTLQKSTGFTNLMQKGRNNKSHPPCILLIKKLKM